MEETSKDKTAFTCHRGFFVFNVMPFGLKNAPPTFSGTMKYVMRNVPRDYLLLYIDDLYVHSETFQEHLKHLEVVFDALRSCNLKLKQSKCNFAKSSTKFLRYEISGNGIEPHKDNIQVVESFPIPKTSKQIRSLLGLCSYYRKFVERFSTIAKPLYALTKKGEPYVWNEKCQESFTILKQVLINLLFCFLSIFHMKCANSYFNAIFVWK